jgi:hypothetical protein
MKSKYLVQIAAQNPMFATGGFFTIDGAMTRAVAEEKAAAVRSAEQYARGEQARAIRVIATAKWRVEHSAANRAAMKG